MSTGAKRGLLQDSKKKPRLRLPPRILKAQKLTFYTVSGNPGASPYASASGPVPLRTSQPFRPRVAPGRGRVWTAEGQGALAARRRRVGWRGTGGVGAALVRPGWGRASLHSPQHPKWSPDLRFRAPACSCRLSIFHPSGTIISCDLS